MLAATASTAARLNLICLGRGRSSESGHRKCYISEQVARIILGCTCALLIGHTVIRSLYQKLSGTLYSYYGKDAERDIKPGACAVSYELSVDTAGNALGYLHTLTTTGTLLNFCSEYDRLNRLNNSNGSVISNRIDVTYCTIGILGT